MCEMQGVIPITVRETPVTEPDVHIMRQLELPLTDTEDLSTPAGVGNRAGGHSHACFAPGCQRCANQRQSTGIVSCHSLAGKLCAQ